MKPHKKNLPAISDLHAVIFRNAPIGIEVYDAQGRLVEVNDACLKIFGVDDVSHVKKFKLFEDPNVSEEFKESLRRGSPVSYESTFDFDLIAEKNLYPTSRSGTISLSVIIDPIPCASDGAVCGYIVLVQDITERKNGEEERCRALAETRQRRKELEALLSGARQILEEKDFQTNARAIFDAAREMTGATSGYVALLNKESEENEVLFLEAGGLPCSVDPSLPMPIRGLRATAYASGRAVYHNDFMGSEWAAFMPSGHVTLRNVMFAPLNLNSKTVGIMGLANKDGDFTEEDRRIAEAFGQLAAIALRNSRNLEAIRESERTNATIISNLPGFVYRCANDPDWTMEYISNDCREITGYLPDDFINNRRVAFNDIVHPDFKEPLWSQWQEALARREPFEGEYPVLRRDGTIRWVWERGQGVFSDIGDLLFLEGFITDTTLRKQAEDERERLTRQIGQSQKFEAIGQLAGGIAHDFNNILGGIIGFADMSLDYAPPGSGLRKNLEQILRAGERAKSLVRQILSFSRQNVEVKLPIHMKPIVSEAAQLLRATLPATIRISTELEEDTGTVLADAAKIHEIIMNLGTNAAHAMEESGVLEISLAEWTIDADLIGRLGTSRPGLYSVVTVKDSGCGMSEETMAHIFEPFFTTKEIGKGTGMGLAVVFGVVQDHGGNIIVSSRPGEGSTFRIFLPKSDMPAVPEEEELRNIVGGNERILFVDDETSLVDLTREMLGSLGYRTTAVADSLDALEIFSAAPHDFDLVITDQTMPGLTGVQLALELHRIRPDLPIILCTGYSKGVQEEGILKTGIRCCMIKPLRMKELASMIRRVLDGKTRFTPTTGTSQ